MKKLLLIGAFGLLLSTSCSSTQHAGSSAQPAPAGAEQALNQKKSAFKGTWQITSVDYQGKFKIKPFDEGADSKCFIGSEWKLVPNNNTGSYILQGSSECPSVTRQIKFDLTSSGNFQFKKIAPELKAKEVVAGYILQLQSQSENNFVLTQNIPFEGEIIKVYYTFERISK